jgi:hypothetical protein
MSMVSVPSLEAGARSLPAELRSHHDGWDRLHKNLTPVTDGGHIGPNVYHALNPGGGLHGLGDTFTAADGSVYDSNTGALVYDASASVPDVTIPSLPTADYFPPVDLAPQPGLPVIYSAPAPGQPPAPVDYAKLINAGVLSLAQLTAIQQGGSVRTADGTIYGSSAGAVVSAGNPAAQLDVSTAGVKGLLSSPVLLIGLGVLAFVFMSKNR